MSRWRYASFFVRRGTERKGGGSGDGIRFPYASLYLLGMRMGYRPHDLDGMRLGTMIHMADAYADANNQGKGKDQPREATQADIAAVFC